MSPESRLAFPESGVFGQIANQVFKHQNKAVLHLPVICGGTPTDPKVAEGWIKTKLGIDSSELLREKVAQIMSDHNVTVDEATKIANEMGNLNRFKRDSQGRLYLEGRCLKANLKEAVSICVAAGTLKSRGWGETKKWLTNFLPEHVFVMENKLFFKDSDGNYVTDSTGINQRFIATRFGSGIKYEEHLDDVFVEATIVADYYFTDSQWGTILVTGGMNGLGASRSQGYGRYEVKEWSMIN